MEIINWYIGVWKNFFGFEGRAGRSEFWYFVLVNFIVSLLFNVISATLGMIYSLAVLIPSIALGIRRMHDIGKSGWWLLIALIPIIGFFVLIFFYVQPSEEGENRFGSSAPTEPQKFI